MRTVSILGAGNAGSAVGKLLRIAGYRIDYVVTRRAATAARARRFIGAGKASTHPEDACASEIVILGVPDDTIEPLTRRLRFRHIALHLCGSYPSGIIHNAPHPASLHPIRSFADPALAVKTFCGTFCSYEGTPHAERVVKRMILDIGGVPLRVRGDAKPLYHAASVFASNYLVAILDAALELMRRAGVTRTDAILALAEGVLRNVRRAGIPDALSGPIERGDARTVALHLKSLASTDRELLELYASLARRTVRVARAKGTSERLLEKIQRLL